MPVISKRTGPAVFAAAFVQFACLLVVPAGAAGGEDCNLRIAEHKPSTYKNYAVYVRVGGDVEVTCRGQTDDLKWFVYRHGDERCQDDADMRYQDKCYSLPDTSKQLPRGTFAEKLHIHNANKDLEANYTCKSLKGVCSAITISVFVFDPPVFKVSQPQDMTIRNQTNLTLSCELSAQQQQQADHFVKPSPDWFLNGKQIHEGGGGGHDRIKIHDANATLFIDHPTRLDSGIYMCAYRTRELNRDRHPVVIRNIIQVSGAALVMKPSRPSKNFVQGQTGSVECEVYGHPTPQVKWKRDDKPQLVLTASSRVSLQVHEGVSHAKLVIRDLTFDDRAEYRCIANNTYGNDSSATLLRVKDKLAALYPFLGIVAELAILAVIIVVYEKRRRRKEHDEDEANTVAGSALDGGGDAAGATTNDHKPSAATPSSVSRESKEVRQRKS